MAAVCLCLVLPFPKLKPHLLWLRLHLLWLRLLPSWKLVWL